MNPYKISVIVPIYNMENYLEKCLDNLINQTLKEIEIICINDGSVDNSLKILKNFANKDNRIIILNQKNQGQGIARNNGIKIARGEYIGFCDPDDWIELNMFENMYNKAIQNQADIVECDFISHYEHRNKIKRNKLSARKYKKIKHIKPNTSYTYRDILEESLANFVGMSWVRIYKKSMIDKFNIKFAECKHWEDHTFTIDAIYSANKIYYLPKAYYHYLIRNGSSIHGNFKNSIDALNIVYEVEKILKKHNLYNSLVKEFEEYTLSLMSFFCYYAGNEKNTFLNKCRQILSEELYAKLTNKLNKQGKNSFIQNIFSVKNEITNGRIQKIITILFIKFKIK